MGQVEKYNLRLEMDEEIALKLEKLSIDSGLSKAAVIRTLIHNAKRIVPKTEWETKNDKDSV